MPESILSTPSFLGGIRLAIAHLTDAVSVIRQLYLEAFKGKQGQLVVVVIQRVRGTKTPPTHLRPKIRFRAEYIAIPMDVKKLPVGCAARAFL